MSTPSSFLQLKISQASKHIKTQVKKITSPLTNHFHSNDVYTPVMEKIVTDYCKENELMAGNPNIDTPANMITTVFTSNSTPTILLFQNQPPTQKKHRRKDTT